MGSGASRPRLRLKALRFCVAHRATQNRCTLSLRRGFIAPDPVRSHTSPHTQCCQYGMGVRSLTPHAVLTNSCARRLVGPDRIRCSQASSEARSTTVLRGTSCHAEPWYSQPQTRISCTRSRQVIRRRQPAFLWSRPLGLAYSKETPVGDSWRPDKI